MGLQPPPWVWTSPAMRTWESYLAVLSLDFLIWKMGTMKPHLSDLQRRGSGCLAPPWHTSESQPMMSKSSLARRCPRPQKALCTPELRPRGPSGRQFLFASAVGRL